MMDNDGFVWNKENDKYSYKVKYFLLQEDDNGNIAKGTDYFTLDTYAVGGTGLSYADCKLIEIANVSKHSELNRT